MSEWQPIETAPKDGRVLLLGRENAAGKWRTMRGQWITQAEIEEWGLDEADMFDAGWFETCVEADEPPSAWVTEPTHWMPLPDPPENSHA